MNSAKNKLIILATIIMSISAVSAKSIEKVTPNQNSNAGLAINIIQQNQEEFRGRLINADQSYFVFENIVDATIQLIPRADVKVLETNMDVDLLGVVKSHNPDSLTDVIELNDGTKIPSIILDVTPEGIQYFTGESLRRQLLSTDEVYSIHMDSDSVEIPFPMIAVYTPTL